MGFDLIKKQKDLDDIGIELIVIIIIMMFLF